MREEISCSFVDCSGNGGHLGELLESHGDHCGHVDIAVVTLPESPAAIAVLVGSEIC